MMKTTKVDDINNYVNLVNNLRKAKSGFISLENVLLAISKNELEEYIVEILVVPILDGSYVAVLNPPRVSSSLKEDGIVNFEHVISVMKITCFEFVISIFGEVYVISN